MGPQLQRPEWWNTYNGRIIKVKCAGVSVSNWTELAIWKLHPQGEYQSAFYFVATREVLEHEGQLVATSEFIQLDPSDKVSVKRVRYRTVGDMTCTAAVESTASNIDDIIHEIIATKTSERGETRIDDKVSEAAMEDRKKSGYF